MENDNISKKQRDDAIQFLDKLKSDLEDISDKAKINSLELLLSENKYGLVFEKHKERVFSMLENSVPVFKEDSTRRILSDDSKNLNFILEGDNLHSLYLLEKTHKRNIDAIYIDPPYNTGAKDWKYNNNYVDNNDLYRHSKWLSMMAERLKIAKKLLKPNGVLICAIDENELATLSLLLEDVFGLDYKIDTICIVQNPRGVQGDNFSYTNEYALFVYKRGTKAISNRTIEEEDIEFSNLRNWGSESERSDAKNCFYPVFVKEGKIIGCGPVLDDSIHPEQTTYDASTGINSVYPIDIKGVERKWRYATQSFDDIKHLLRAKESKGRYEIELGKNFGTYKTVWTDKKYDANEYGTKLINDMVPANDFDFPKSLYNVYDCLYAVIQDKPNAVVLDFFAGSGTTGHAVLLMNKLIGGNRKFILCTNNDVGIEKEKEFAKANPTCVNLDGSINCETVEYRNFEEKFGIARSVTWPRINSAINGYISSNGSKTIIFDEKIPLKMFEDQKKSESFCDKYKRIKDENKNQYDSFKTVIEDGKLRIYGINNKKEKVPGLGGNCVYFKTDFVPKNSNEDDLSDLLLPHIRELICLSEMSNVEEDKILLSDDDFDKFVINIDRFKGKKIYVSPYLLITKEMRQKSNSLNILINKIPSCFYEYELKEAGEEW